MTEFTIKHRRASLALLFAFVLLLIFFGVLVIAVYPTLVRILFGIGSIGLGFVVGFHLLPQIRNACGPSGKCARWIGRGKQVASIALSIHFILLLEVLLQGSASASPILFMLGVLLASVQVVLALFPGNHWEIDRYSSQWESARTVPFLLLAIDLFAQSLLIALSEGWSTFYAYFWIYAALVALVYLSAVWLRRKNSKASLLMITLFFLVLVFAALGLLL
jgi:hypothetical protein